MKRLKNFLCDEQGQDLVEYALLAGFVAAVVGAVFERPANLFYEMEGGAEAIVYPYPLRSCGNRSHRLHRPPPEMAVAALEGLLSERSAPATCMGRGSRNRAIFFLKKDLQKIKKKL